TAGGGASLDEQVQMALTFPLASLQQLAGDLSQVVGGAVLSSVLRVTPGAPGQYLGEHTLSSLALAPTAARYDLQNEPLPVISVGDVPLTWDGAHLTVGAHRFTLHLPYFWRRAFLEI